MEYNGYTIFVVFSLIFGGYCQTPPDCCLNDLCPYYCVRCDGTAQCFDLSDELGCSTEGDKKLNSFSKPPIFVPFVLKTITSQLRKEKEAVAPRFPNRQCIRPPNVQNKPRNTYITDTNEREDIEEGYSLRVTKFRGGSTTSPTTEAPVWLQLLRKLQAEQQASPTTTTTTTPAPSTTTTIPKPTTTTDPPWLALLKNLIQVVKGNSTTTLPQLTSTEQQTESWQTGSVQSDSEPVSLLITSAPSTTEGFINTTTASPTTTSPSSTSDIQNFTSTVSSITTSPGDPLSTSATLISSLANEKIATSIPLIITQSSQTPADERPITTKVARITTTNSLAITTEGLLNNVSKSETSHVYGLSQGPRSNLSYEISTKTTVGEDMNNKQGAINVSHGVVSTQTVQTDQSETSTETVTGVPIQFDLISTKSIEKVINLTSNMSSIWNTSTDSTIELTPDSLTEEGLINVTLSSSKISDNLTNMSTPGSYQDKLGWNDTVNVTESTLMDFTVSPPGNFSNSTTAIFQDVIKTSTHDTTSTTFTTRTDAPSIQSNIMKLIDKLLSKINETESEFANSSSSTTTKFPVELKHFYTNFTANDTDTTEMKQTNISSRDSKFIRELTPRVGLIEIGEVTTSMDIPTLSTDFTSITNGTTQINNTSNIAVETDLNNVTNSPEDNVTTDRNPPNSSVIIANSLVLINSSEIRPGQIRLSNDITSLMPSSIREEKVITTESEVDILLQEVRKTLNETKSRLSDLTDQIYSLENNATEMNTTFRSFNTKDSTKPTLFKYGLITDFQADNDLSNFTVDRSVGVKPILLESNQRDTVTVTINDGMSRDTVTVSTNDEMAPKVNKPAVSTPMPWLYQTTSFPFDNFWDSITSQSPLMDSVFNPMPSNTIWSSLFDTWSLGTLGLPTTPRKQNFDTIPTTTKEPVEMATKTSSQAPPRLTPKTHSRTTSMAPPRTTSQAPPRTTSQAPPRTTPQVPPRTSSQAPPRTSSQTPPRTSSQTPSLTTSRMPSWTTAQTPPNMPDQKPVEALPSSTVAPVTFLRTEPPLANGVQIPVIRTQDFIGLTETNKTKRSTPGTVSDEIYFVLRQGKTTRSTQTPSVTDPRQNLQVTFVTEPGVNFDNETKVEINTNFTISKIPIVSPETDSYINSEDNSNRIGNIRIESSITKPQTTTASPVSITPFFTVSNEVYVIKPTSKVTTPTPVLPTTMIPSATTSEAASLLKNKSQLSPDRRTKDKLRQDWWDQDFQPTTWFPFETQYPTNTPIPWNTIDKQLATGIDSGLTTTVSNDVGCMLLQDASAFCKDLYSGQYKNPDDCKTYFVCDWGDLYRCQCPPNTSFDGKLRVCNWDYAVTC